MDIPLDYVDETGELKDVPFEALPVLAANERFVTVADRLRELKTLKDAHFEKRGKLPSEWDELKTEAGALAMAAGVKSVAYIDLRIANAEGGESKGKITGAGMIEQYEKNSDLPMPYEQLRAIALSAKECDPDTLAQYGIPAQRIAAAREPGKGRSSSVRVEWIGSKGKGGKGRAAGSGGGVQ